MAYTYKGTKITGTSTTAKVFKKSGIKSAKKNQTYFNTATGHVYSCDTAGKPDTAKWKYVRTDIAKKPALQVSNLAVPSRTTSGSNTYIMTTKWKVPSGMTNVKKGDRAESLTIDWWLGIAGKDPKRVKKNVGTGATESTVNLNNFVVGSKTYTRQSFYPISGKPKLTYVSAGVKAHNSKGDGPEAKETRQFTKPKTPTIAAWEFDTEHGEAKTSISTNAGTGYAERYDTRYIVTITDTKQNKTWQHRNTSGMGTSIPISYDAPNYQALDPDKEYIKVDVDTWARGFAGDSEPTKSTYYISYPAKTTIEGIDVSGKSPADKCTVRINTNHKASHPVDQVRLGYMANTEYESASDIPGEADWTWTDIIDDNTCEALAMPVGDLLPEPGKHTWVCVKSFHANENVLFRYSDFREVEALYTPASTAADDSIVIVDAHAGADGESAVVQLAWDPDGTDDSTGTELTWSDELDTWKSTKEPDSHEFEWEDTTSSGQPVPITYEGETYRHSATITIKGLSEGSTYFVKARRYLDGDPITYSPYSNTATVVTSEKPESVVASCNRYVSAGSNLQVYWTFAGNGLQRKWQIVQCVLETIDEEDVWVDYAVIASGEGSIGSAQISAERLGVFATDNSVSFNVQVSTGSGFVVSDPCTVDILERPEVSITATSPLTAQSLSFGVTASRVCDLIVVVTSQGASGQMPQGVLRQTRGDTVHSDVYTPTWTASNDEFTTTVDLPGGLDFWDGAEYTLSVIGVDRETGLRSEEQTATVAIAWSHQAPVPFDFVTLTPLDYMDDENDMHHQAVQIDLTPPTNAVATDTYDIYRMTGDGAKLIGQSFPLTCTVVDEYAPFGDDLTLYYRIALRTADGDVAFSDIEYNLEGSAMRFDWSGGTLELPYNLSIADSYTKDVDIRKHMDGSMDGYWNQNIERSGSLSSDAIRLVQQDDITAARQLARYPGAVFVRTPDGSAYEADVQVSDLSTEGVMTAIAIDAQEIGLTQEFILPTPYPLEDEEEQESD